MPEMMFWLEKAHHFPLAHQGREAVVTCTAHASTPVSGWLFKQSENLPWTLKLHRLGSAQHCTKVSTSRVEESCCMQVNGTLLMLWGQVNVKSCLSSIRCQNKWRVQIIFWCA